MAARRAAVVDTLRGWTRAGAHAARRPRPVRGLLPLPPGRGRRGHVRRASSRRSSTSRTCACTSSLSIREDALGEARPLQGQHPAPLRELRPRRAPRPRGGARGDRGPRRRVEPPPAADEPPYTLEPALVDAVIDAAAAGELALVRERRRAATASPAANAASRRPFLQLVMERLWRATVEAGAHDLTLARLEALGGPQRIVENHLLEALGTLDRRRAGRRRRSLPLPRHALEDEDRAPGVRPRRVDGALRGRGRRRCSRSSAAARAAASSAASRRPPAGPARRATSSSTTSSPSRSSSGGASTSRTAAGRRRSGAFARIAGGLAVLARGRRQRSASGRSSSGARPRPRRARRRRSRSRRPPTTQVATTSGRLRSCSGSRRYRASPSAEAASAMVERARGRPALGRGGDPPRRRRRAFGRSRSAPTGSTLAAADFDGTVRLWDTPGAKAARASRSRAHTSEVWGLAFSPDGKTLASVELRRDRPALGASRTRARSGEPIDPGVGAVTSVAFSPDGRTRRARRLRRHGAALGRRRRRSSCAPLRGPHGARSSASPSAPTGRCSHRAARPDRAAAGTLARAGRSATRSRVTSGTVASVAFSPDGRTLASVGPRRRPCGCGARTPEKPLGPTPAERDGPGLGRRVQPGREDARVVGVRRDGAAVGRRGPARLSGDPLEGHTRAGDRRRVRAGRDARVVELRRDGAALGSRALHRLGDPIGTHDDRVTAVSVSPDGSTVASGSFDQTVGLWDVRGAKRRHDGSVTTSSTRSRTSPTAPTGRSSRPPTRAAPSGCGRTRPASRRGWQGRGAVQDIAFDGDGSTLAAGDSDGAIQLWDVASQEAQGEPLTGHDGPVWSVALSADGGTLVSAGSDGTVRVWDVDERRGDRPAPARRGRGRARRRPRPGRPHPRDRERRRSGAALGPPSRDSARRARRRAHPANVESVAFADGRLGARVGRWRRSGPALGRARISARSGGRSGDTRARSTAVAFGPDAATRLRRRRRHRPALGRDPLARPGGSRDARSAASSSATSHQAEWQELAPGLPYRTTCPT